MKKTAKKNSPSKKSARIAPDEPPTAKLGPMERARRRVEASRQAVINKAVLQSPE